MLSLPLNPSYNIQVQLNNDSWINVHRILEDKKDFTVSIYGKCQATQENIDKVKAYYPDMQYRAMSISPTLEHVML